jgi:hypothetical protein
MNRIARRWHATQAGHRVNLANAMPSLNDMLNSSAKALACRSDVWLGLNTNCGSQYGTPNHPSVNSPVSVFST